jgi:hypothetical protein
MWVLGSSLFERATSRYIRLAPVGLLLLFALPVCVGQTDNGPVGVPDSPDAHVSSRNKAGTAEPCEIKRGATAMVEAGAVGVAATNPDDPAISATLKLEPCPPLAPFIDWYARFLNGPAVKKLTPREKGWLAVRDVIDPFNGLTIAANSAIFVGANSHSAYGPGMRGFGRNVRDSYSQDATGEFFGTFLIPSIAHQDPHYHRLPRASMKRRIAHALYQVVWTQGDNGGEMLNYANLVGFAIDDEVGNLYVPGQQTDLPASARRYAIGLATAPVENFITEFLPDLASHIHVRVVLVQQIINQVARTGNQ